MKKKIILIGGGGHAKVVIDAIRVSGKYDIYGIADQKLSKGTGVSGVKVIGTDKEIEGIFHDGVKIAFIALGSTGDCRVRRRIDVDLKRIGFKLPKIVHPSATVAEDVEIGEGTFVAAGAVINPGTKIGRNVIVNTSSSVDHDCLIGDFAHIAPGVTLSGGVKIGAETHVGTGASVIHYLTIGERCMIGAGLTIRRDIRADIKQYSQGQEVYENE